MTNLGLIRAGTLAVAILFASSAWAVPIVAGDILISIMGEPMFSCSTRQRDL